MSGFLKFIAPLVHPIGFAWLMLLVGTAVCLRRRRRLGSIVCGTAALMTWIVSQPWLTTPLVGSLERPWLDHTLAHATDADAVVVLGGGWRASQPDFASLDLTQCGDRLMAGFELCRQGKARALVVGGDPTEPPPGMNPSSQQVGWWFREWKLSPAEFHSLGPVRTTRDEARRTRELADRLGWKKILLVTSALHMRRSVDAFEKAGLTVIPVACDFQVLRFKESTAGWKAFPDDESILTFSLWWHEQLGWLAYRLLGHL